MKTKLIGAALVAAIALALVGAREVTSRPLVETGKTYNISNGATAVQGTVTEDLGNGWFMVERKDGRKTKVNVAQALWVDDYK